MRVASRASASRAGRSGATAGGRSAAAGARAAAALPPLGGAAPPSHARAYWLDGETLATPLPPTGFAFALVASETAELRVCEVDGRAVAHDALRLPLRASGAGLPDNLRLKWPHLSRYTPLRLPDGVSGLAQQLLRSQLVLEAAPLGGTADAGDDDPTTAGGADAGRALVTGVQCAGVLDALCVYDGPLGAQFEAGGEGDGVTLRVWAPTALAVTLLLYDGPRGGATPTEVPCLRGERGVWSCAGSWRGRWYTWRVTAFHPSTGALHDAVSPDPYATRLAANGARAHAVPEGAPWAEGEAEGGRGFVPPPPLAHHADAVLYELHTRDFSARDDSVPEHLCALQLWACVGGARRKAGALRC